MPDRDELIELTADIVSSHVANNSVAVGDVANLVQQVHEALAGLGIPAAAPAPEKKEPVVSIRASVKPVYIVCMECGKRQKTLKRHLQVAHGMSPSEYRKDYGLPDAYPMTAPNYSELRRETAKRLGLGRKAGGAAAEASTPTSPAPAKRGRPKKAPPTA